MDRLRRARGGGKAPCSIDELPMLFAQTLGLAQVRLLGDRIAAV